MNTIRLNGSTAQRLNGSTAQRLNGSTALSGAKAHGGDWTRAEGNFLPDGGNLFSPRAATPSRHANCPRNSIAPGSAPSHCGAMELRRQGRDEMEFRHEGNLFPDADISGPAWRNSLPELGNPEREWRNPAPESGNPAKRLPNLFAGLRNLFAGWGKPQRELPNPGAEAGNPGAGFANPDGEFCHFFAGLAGFYSENDRWRLAAAIFHLTLSQPVPKNDHHHA